VVCRPAVLLTAATNAEAEGLHRPALAIDPAYDQARVRLARHLRDLRRGFVARLLRALWAGAAR
jgi:hypothetical protein